MKRIEKTTTNEENSNRRIVYSNLDELHFKNPFSQNDIKKNYYADDNKPIYKIKLLAKTNSCFSKSYFIFFFLIILMMPQLCFSKKIELRKLNY